LFSRLFLLGRKKGRPRIARWQNKGDARFEASDSQWSLEYRPGFTCVICAASQWRGARDVAYLSRRYQDAIARVREEENANQAESE